MRYEEARVYLDHVSKYGSVLGLDSIKRLLDKLENPQNDLKFIHIAGTNGKGSVTACVFEILSAAGFRVGCYTSPTVTGYLERFQLSDRWMTEEELAFFVAEMKEKTELLLMEGHPSPTVFEMETAIAFRWFQKECCDFVVLETGMGGETDATNVIPAPAVCAFASISMDHVGVLGTTLSEIAGVKAGIIKPGSRVVIGKQEETVETILRERAITYGCPIYEQDVDVKIGSENLQGITFSTGEYKDLHLKLTGRYQLENAGTALRIIDALNDAFGEKRIGEAAVRAGLAKASMPGRFQLLSEDPVVIADGAHNADAICRLAENIERYLGVKPKDRLLIGVMGVFRDKDYPAMVEKMAPYYRRMYTIDLPHAERTLAKENLAAVYQGCGVEAMACESVEEAVRDACLQAKRAGTAVVIFGSLSYLGEAIESMRKL